MITNICFYILNSKNIIFNVNAEHVFLNNTNTVVWIFLTIISQLMFAIIDNLYLICNHYKKENNNN